MNLIKRINFLVLSWSIEALNQDVEETPKIDFAVGGQAVIEGVMMRSPNNITIAVRKENGTVKVRSKKYLTMTQKHKWLNVPILRGVINLFEMMIVGTEAINFSANEQIEVEKPKAKPQKKSAKYGKFFEYLMFALSFIIGIGLSIFLFKFIPLAITTFLQGKSAYIAENYMVFNLIDGFLKMSIFLSYIFLLSQIPSFRRIFEYHGAEHKSIFNYESKKPLTVENADEQIRFHPRCGTSFILIVFVVSILVYTFIPQQPNFWLNLLVRLAFLPIIAGISYEYLKLSARHAQNPIVKMLIAPGLWFQRLTTKEPNRKQLEVGLTSLKDALAAEGIAT